MIDREFDIRHEDGQFIVYVNGEFFCSAETFDEIAEKLRELFLV